MKEHKNFISRLAPYVPKDVYQDRYVLVVVGKDALYARTKHQFSQRKKTFLYPKPDQTQGFCVADLHGVLDDPKKLVEQVGAQVSDFVVWDRAEQTFPQGPIIYIADSKMDTIQNWRAKSPDIMEKREAYFASRGYDVSPENLHAIIGSLRLNTARYMVFTAEDDNVVLSRAGEILHAGQKARDIFGIKDAQVAFKIEKIAPAQTSASRAESVSVCAQDPVSPVVPAAPASPTRRVVKIRLRLKRGGADILREPSCALARKQGEDQPVLLPSKAPKESKKLKVSEKSLSLPCKEPSHATRKIKMTIRACGKKIVLGVSPSG